MDSYPGSTPLNFIPFRLENLPKKNVAEPTTSQANVHATCGCSSSEPIGLQVESTDLLPVPPSAVIEEDSPANSQGSSTDVTAYAEAMVRKIEQQQEHASQQVGTSTSDSNGNVPPVEEATSVAPHVPKIRRSSTPISSEGGEEASQADLSALESALHVIITSESQLPELRDRTDPESANISGAHSRTDNENASSVCDAPALPGKVPQVHFLGGQINPVALYGFNPFYTESGTEGGDETSSEVLVPGTSKDPAPNPQSTQSRFPDFFGRSRAILKEYFDEAAPIRLPEGHSTVPFTEPQIYHLLRGLTDETLNRSFSTMERMVTDAVRGSPTVAPFRTAHFHSIGPHFHCRCHTPMRRSPSRPI